MFNDSIMYEIWENIEEELNYSGLNLKIDGGHKSKFNIEYIQIKILDELYDGQTKVIEIIENVNTVSIIFYDNLEYLTEHNELSSKEAEKAEKVFEYLNRELKTIADKLEKGLSIYEKKEINSIFDLV